MKKLLVATSNKNKLPEILKELSGLDVDIISLNNIGDIPDVEETGETFEENAILKARVCGDKTGYLTLADDSGLCVDALDGRPGVYSARYAPGPAENRNNKLLDELTNVPKEKRTARYVAAIAIYDPQSKQVWTCGGVCEGLITTEPTGNDGFGYDPIFYCLDLNKAMAQVNMDEKNRVSHRGQAIRKAREILKREVLPRLGDTNQMS